MDAMLLLDEAAEWLRMTPRELSRQAKAGTIPCVRLSARSVRFHPRTIIAKFTPKTHQ